MSFESNLKRLENDTSTNMEKNHSLKLNPQLAIEIQFKSQDSNK